MTTDRASARQQAEAILAELDGIAATAYRDPTPIPTVGPTPPVAQPGRPPMSQRATDASALMLTAGLATVPPGLIAIGVLMASGYADPAVIGMICAAPAVIAVPVIAVARLLRSAQGIVPAEHHNHYHGPVSQQHHTVSTQTRGLFAKTINKQ
ncbi:hypothetical protein ACIQU4_15560 [Streptomyces sp. NPDC090741]|uniref:hypothetical protein n=1 Tax=Streptomyces sp. NPDC090741 TaxID=3365967 RepID=UPI0037FEB4FF